MVPTSAHLMVSWKAVDLERWMVSMRVTLTAKNLELVSVERTAQVLGTWKEDEW